MAHHDDRHSFWRGDAPPRQSSRYGTEDGGRGVGGHEGEGRYRAWRESEDRRRYPAEGRSGGNYVTGMGQPGYMPGPGDHRDHYSDTRQHAEREYGGGRYGPTSARHFNEGGWYGGPDRFSEPGPDRGHPSRHYSAEYGGQYGSQSWRGGGEHLGDPDYLDWRERQLGEFDRQYRDWRDAQARRYDEEYGNWRKERQDRFHRDFSQWRENRDRAPDQAGEGSGENRSGSGTEPAPRASSGGKSGGSA